VLIVVVSRAVRSMKAESGVSERLSDAMQNSITIAIVLFLVF